MKRLMSWLRPRKSEPKPVACRCTEAMLGLAHPDCGRCGGSGVLPPGTCHCLDHF